MVDLPSQRDVYSVVERDYDSIQLSFHDTYDSTVEFVRQIESFRNRLTVGATVLIVGGSASECRYFRECGFDVTNLDLSKRMAEHVSTTTQVRSLQGNILTFSDGVFDGVWACRSLIHLHPNDFTNGLMAMKALLAEGGLFGCTLFTSDDEVEQQAALEEHADRGDAIYYRCLYSEQRIRRDFAASGLHIVLSEQCADSDGDSTLYVEAVSV